MQYDPKKHGIPLIWPEHLKEKQEPEASKPITEAAIKRFRKWCAKEVKAAIDEGEGDTGQSFCWTDYPPFTKLDNRGEYRWQFSPEEKRYFDIFELFEKVSDEFEIEQLDHETFCVSRRETKPE